MKNVRILLLNVLLIGVRLSASAILLEVESGMAVLSSDISGLVRKIGAGTLLLTGSNALTSLDIAEGAVLVGCKANLNNLA
jgi:uncharacterized protein YoxC